MCTAVDFMGLPLKNPVIVAAGPWSRDAASIQKAIDAGAAAVVTETITLEKSQLLRPRIYRQEGRLLNTTLYSTCLLYTSKRKAAMSATMTAR